MLTTTRTARCQRSHSGEVVGGDQRSPARRRPRRATRAAISRAQPTCRGVLGSPHQIHTVHVSRSKRAQPVRLPVVPVRLVRLTSHGGWFGCRLSGPVVLGSSVLQGSGLTGGTLPYDGNFRLSFLPEVQIPSAATDLERREPPKQSWNRPGTRFFLGSKHHWIERADRPDSAISVGAQQKYCNPLRRNRFAGVVTSMSATACTHGTGPASFIRTRGQSARSRSRVGVRAAHEGYVADACCRRRVTPLPAARARPRRRP